MCYFLFVAVVAAASLAFASTVVLFGLQVSPTSHLSLTPPNTFHLITEGGVKVDNHVIFGMMHV